MAEESKKPDEKEMKIPVFSVLKNGTVVKNIFLNNPQWVCLSEEEEEEEEEEEDSPVLIGRHPDCHIALDHPSISRFHLEIRAKPTSLTLTVTDRSSVHGTWVSGNKIEPNIPVNLMEGDTIKLGTSTRIYQLHWIPLSTAFEMEKTLPWVLKESGVLIVFSSFQFENPNEVLPEDIPPPSPILGTFSSPPETENMSALRKELEEDRTRLSSFVAMSESVGSSGPMEEEDRTSEKNVISDEVQSGKENLSPLASEKRVVSSSVFSRRSKSKSVSFIRIQTGRNEPKNGETICDVEAEVGNQEKHGETICDGEADVGEQEKNGTVTEHGKREETFCRALFIEEEEEETFESDKENMTPLSSKSHKLKRNNIEMQRTLNASAVKSLENVWSLDKKAPTPKAPSNLKQDKPFSDNYLMKERYKRNVSDKENLTAEFSSGHKLEKRPDEIQRSSLNGIAMNGEEDAFHHSILLQGQGMELVHKEGEKKRWNIVVDAVCFLDKESLKSLQLLEGLKGTHLIVPRIVIRELDCLKRRENLFRKDTKAASSVLQWIEECMVRCSWWIHVQSSLETLPVAPTPPATPRSQFGNGTEELGTGASSSVGFSTYGSLTEIVSPTAEDHILDCALLFKRIKGYEQLVVLSNSITLKIKAMAEGLLCETPKEFRASLLDPYSKRFLWSGSSPRGSTWSCVDEAAKIEDYYHQFPDVRRMPKTIDCVKGLKLILLHNYHYGKTNLVK